MRYLIQKHHISVRLLPLTGRMFVYYLFNSADEIIYIGRTKNLYNRMLQHKRNFKLYGIKNKLNDFTDIGLVEFQTEKYYKQYEKTAIIKHKPKYNIQGKC